MLHGFSNPLKAVPTAPIREGRPDQRRYWFEFRSAHGPASAAWTESDAIKQSVTAWAVRQYVHQESLELPHV